LLKVAAKFSFKFSILTIATFALLGIYFATVVDTGRDTYWHLAIGRRVFEEKAIPKIDTFTYGSPETLFTSTEWLSGLIMYAFVQTLGLNTGLLLLRIVIGLTAIYLLYLSLKLITSNEIITLAGISLVGFVLAIRLNDRPEIFSFVFVAFVNYVCFNFFTKQKLSRLTYFLPIVFFAWPNIHAFAPFGLAILAFWTSIFIFEKIYHQKKRGGFGIFFGLFIISVVLSALQNKKFLYPFLALNLKFEILEMSTLPERLMANNGFDFINQVPIEFYFYFLLLITYIMTFIVFLKKGFKNYSIGLICLFYLLLFLTPFRFYRLIPMATLMVLPVVIFQAKQTLLINVKIFGYLEKTAYATLAVMIIISIFSKNIIDQRIGAFVITDLSNPNPKNNIVDIINRSWNPYFPQNAPKIIKNHLTTRRLFTEGGLNDYFLWHIPEIKIFSDIMFEYRTQKDYKNEQIIASGASGWRELLKKYDIDTVVNHQDLPYLLAKTPVWELSNWQLVYVDEIATIYARDDVIKSIPVDLSVIQPELPTTLKFKQDNETKAIEQLGKLMAYEPKNAFAKSQLVAYYITKDLNRAKKLAEESRMIIPYDPIFSVQLAEIYANLNQCANATNYAKEAKRKSFDHIIIKGIANDAISRCQTTLE